MSRRELGWLVALPFAAGSWLSAHCVAYTVVPPASGEHGHLHSASDHSSFGLTPLLAASGVALVLAGLATCAHEGLRGRRPSPPPFRLFALLPASGFAVQEHVERLIGSGTVPYDLVAEPTFLVGLALQVPLAAAALLLARALHSLGYGLGRTLRCDLGIDPLGCHAPCSRLRLPPAATIAVPSVLALGHGQRAPPPGRFP